MGLRVKALKSVTLKYTVGKGDYVTKITRHNPSISEKILSLTNTTINFPSGTNILKIDSIINQSAINVGIKKAQGFASSRLLQTINELGVTEKQVDILKSTILRGNSPESLTGIRRIEAAYKQVQEGKFSLTRRTSREDEYKEVKHILRKDMTVQQQAKLIQWGEFYVDNEELILKVNEGIATYQEKATLSNNWIEYTIDVEDFV